MPDGNTAFLVSRGRERHRAPMAHPHEVATLQERAGTLSAEVASALLEARAKANRMLAGHLPVAITDGY